MNERIKELRKTLGLTLEKFGETLGVSKATISNIENGNRDATEHMFKSICHANWNGNFVNEEWLRTGTGKMFVELPPEDEVGIWVSQLIEERNNPLFDIILETMRTFKQLTPEDQKIVSSYCEQLLHNLKDKKES